MRCGAARQPPYLIRFSVFICPRSRSCRSSATYSERETRIGPFASGTAHQAAPEVKISTTTSTPDHHSRPTSTCLCYVAQHISRTNSRNFTQKPMDAALASLERGLRALFADPTSALGGPSAHPLCECSLQQTPPPDWRYLRRFPVLKRHVLTQFRLVANEMEKQPQTPRKRKKRSMLLQSGNSDEYKALCLASLGQQLARCGLLTLEETEVVEKFVLLETLDVLGRVIRGRLLPLRIRLLLLGFALRGQEEKCVDAAVQSWIRQVCEKVLEEAREATAMGASKAPPSKRVRTRSGDKQTAGADAVVQKSCAFCQNGVTADSLRSEAGGWDFLVECTQRTARVLEKEGESYAMSPTLVALAAFWDPLPVTGLTTNVKTGRRRKRAEISVKREEGIEPSMSVATYERIYHSTLGSIDGLWSASAESKGKVDAFRSMWASVWEREFKSVARAQHVTLVDAIRHCSKADVFAGVVLLPKTKGRVAQLPGFRVVVEVTRSLFAGIAGITTAFAQVWGSAGANCSRAAFFRASSPGASSTKRLVRDYLSELLSSNVQHGVALSSVDKSSGSGRPLEILYFLYDMFSESVTGARQEGGYTNCWDVLMIQPNSEAQSTHDGINWCIFLEKCVLNADVTILTTLGHDSHFSDAFRGYCLGVVYGILATGGDTISSGRTVRRQLIRTESDRSVVRRVLSQMMTTFGEDWIARLVAHLMRANVRLQELSQRGVKSLFFPALVSFMKSTSKSNPKQRKSGQHLFTGIVKATNAVLKESEPTPLYLVPLMRLCDAWDAYQSTHTKEPPTRGNKWGFRAMVELDMLPELLECYGRREILRQETSDALALAADVLQNASNCPPTLEASLYKVLSAVKAASERAKMSAPGSMEGVDNQLASHSSDALQRILRAVKFADVAQTRQLMSELKDAVGTLSELRQQLERWFSFVEVHGSAFAGKESRLELALLCTRLIRWFPDEFEGMRFLLMTPLDSHFVFALKAFVKEAGRPGGSERQAVLGSTARSSLPSAVRVEMAMHLYLSAAPFPDLETLTILLTKALVKCRSRDAFDHLAKVAQNNGRMLLPEAAVVTLSVPLQGLEFSGSALAPQEGDDDEQIKDYTRRAKSSIYQKNALKLLTMSASVFEGGIPWSVALFGAQSAVTWLPYFFEYVLKTDFCEGAPRVELLLANLQGLIRVRADLGVKELRESYWLAALLNTAFVACSRRSAGAYADLEADICSRLRQTTGNVLQLLSISSDGDTTGVNSKDDSANKQPWSDQNGMVALFSGSKLARLAVSEEGVSQSQVHALGAKSAETVHVGLAGAWKSTTEEAAEPPIQLFMPFSHWLSGALVYSQSFLEEPSATMRRWERTFTSYVTDLYLHLQFEGDGCSLLKAWLTTWITSNIVRGQEETQLLALLPSQVALFRRLGLTSVRCQYPPASTSVWQLVFVAVNLAVEQNVLESPAAIEQATELVSSTLTTLELVEMSASADFVRFSSVQEVDPFFEELAQFLAQPLLRACSAAQVSSLLQYPLELLVCCYACKIPANLEAESQLFLQRVRKVLQEGFAIGKQPVAPAPAGGQGNGAESAAPFAVDPTEMDAFFQYWADEMLLKYDYLDRERCAVVLQTIQQALPSAGNPQ
jgi:hypothetical protein